jgi:hypothetical protein
MEIKLDPKELEDKVTHACGATSSECPDFAQIPLTALIALANRFKLGEAKHGRDNWRKGLSDKRYVIERLNHVAFHAMKLAHKIENGLPLDTDDDAGAIMWGGAFAVEAVRVRAPKEGP